MTLDPNFKLEPSKYDKAAKANDTSLGNPTLTPAQRDAKPSTDLTIVGTMADANQQANKAPSNVKELDLGGKQPSDQVKNTPKNNIKQSDKATPPKPVDPIIFQTAIGDKIPDSLTNMMLMSKAVHEDSINVDNSDPANPKTYIPRISSSITTDPNTKEQIVTYYIEKVAKPMKPSGDGTSGGGTTGNPGTDTSSSNPGDTPAQTNTQAENATKLPDILEYDYIYTGKNVDVIQFDMNVKLAFNSLKAVNVVHPTATNTNKDITPDNQTITNKTPNDKAGESRDTPTSRIRANSTADDNKTDHVGPSVVDPGRIGSGSLSPETLFAARKNLSDQISSMMGTNPSVLKLVGNPLLLAGYVMPANTYEDATPESVKSKQDAHQEKTGGTSGGLLRVKVNIRSPKPSYMQGKPLGVNDNSYSTPFWMDKNQYYIKKITHKFTKGEFVQFLELISQGEQTSSEHNNLPAKHPPTTVSKPAGESINETKGANVKAFLDMISHAEGTYGKGDNGYNVLYGGKLFEGYATHPWHVKPWSTGKKTHTPAGRYQIIVDTYDRNKASCGGDFSPSSQDRLAVAIMKAVRNSYSDVVKGDPKSAINKLKPTTWTALQKSEATLLKWYEQHGGTYKPQTSDDLPSSSTTQVPTGARNPEAVNKLNNGLASGSKNAKESGVKYELGARDPKTGKVDCSGWVLSNTKDAAANSNDPGITEGYNLMKKGGTAAGIVQTVGQASGKELTGSEVNTNNLKPGMVIGVDYGSGSTGAGRYKGIDHIVQVIQDPNTGKLQISESASSAGGIRVQDADTWLSKRKNSPKYAVDPFYKSR